MLGEHYYVAVVCCVPIFHFRVKLSFVGARVIVSQRGAVDGSKEAVGHGTVHPNTRRLYLNANAQQAARRPLLLPARITEQCPNV